MLFNSYTFIFGFFPLVLIIYAALHRLSLPMIARGFLVCASWGFYAYWNPKYLLLLIATLVCNFAFGHLLTLFKHRLLVAFGIGLNLILLGYFKYADFFIGNVAKLMGTEPTLLSIVLPLGISFHTFQQIAYLVDMHRGKTVRHRFSDYILFVCFFPQLLAGPIVRDNEMLSQFSGRSFSLRADHLSIGLSIFLVGLFKKVVLADSVAPFADTVFGAADGGASLTLMDAWLGALAYSLQIYFDFSGYTDMAIGIARTFGIMLPPNFNSPYKSQNIAEFWRRWHMTLSRFLRDYLYIPLGGNRKGSVRRYTNLMLTMVLGGLWHGADWNFVIWGALHGSYLVVHQIFSGYLRRSNTGRHNLTNGANQHFATVITFVAVLVAWVFFRARTLNGAHEVLAAMVGSHGFAFSTTFVVKRDALAWIVPLCLIAYMFPNTQQVFSGYRPVLEVDGTAGEIERYTWPRWAWSPTLAWACTLLVLMLASFWQLSKVSEFIYFQF